MQVNETYSCSLQLIKYKTYVSYVIHNNYTPHGREALSELSAIYMWLFNIIIRDILQLTSGYIKYMLAVLKNRLTHTKGGKNFSS